MFAVVFPSVDPVLVSIGPFQVHWYALAYVAGFVLGIALCKRLAVLFRQGPTAQDYDDFLVWVVLGTVLGGRLGYVLFYQLAYYAEHPLEAFQIWHGGMSFHGGMLGVICAAWLFTRRRGLSFLAFADALACVTPIGLGLGRLANFINGELYGRVADLPWAVVFPRGGELPRHPSQIYEALMEGVVLLVVMLLAARVQCFRQRVGALSGLFLSGYGLFRFLAEFFREPDEQLGFLYAGATMGQILCIPMFFIGVCLMVFALRRNRSAA